MNVYTLPLPMLDDAVWGALAIIYPCNLGYTAARDQFFRPSQSWKDGGPVIECERISIGFCGPDSSWPGQWFAEYDEDGTFHAVGPTPLLAAMRSLVMRRLGAVGHP